MRCLVFLPVLLAALVVLLMPGDVRAQQYAPYGCPTELASLTFPEPRACIDLQSWWQPVFNKSTFPFASMHVHMDPPFPYGERIVLPASGQSYSQPYLVQYHNEVGGTVRQVRAGTVGISCSDTSIPKDPNYKGVPISVQDQRHAGQIPFNATKVNCWRATTGVREFRFTADTSSADGGKRQYESCACRTFINAAGAPIAFTIRGWYQGGDYVNLNLTTKIRASTLATTGLPSTISYSLAQGATMASAYVDANIHAGSKGIVLFEYRTGSSGTFTLPVLAPGDHSLLIGGIEMVGSGASGGFARIPFSR